ncbi:hypothetical protein cypCar_00003781 [Cyprinus carpio]|nr:hypothetical protein cypCar_00003781 [Cyprinus carpio]
MSRCKYFAEPDSQPVAMSTSSLRRQVKNIVHNYSEAEIKVREATSNDPWGPSSSLMSEIADLTYNVVAFSEIMSMVWKRLNDHGKNWRHVYKAMTLMEYLIKTGSERVAQQCRENIYAVQTLKDFQYIDRDGKDQGVNVREKAKQLVTLLKDEERLREERIHALKTKEKMAQTSSASSAPSAPALGGGLHSGADPEQAWPQSSGEEDLQLQLALAMSKEEAEQVKSQRSGFQDAADPERRGSSVIGGDTGGGGSTGSPVPFDLSSLSSSLPVRKTPESFLGPNAALVDLDSLVSSKPKPKQPPPPSISSTSHNPFLQTQGPSSSGMGVTPGSNISSRGVSPTPPSASNPFGTTPMASISPQPSSLGLNQLRTSPVPQNPMLGHMPPPAVGMVQPGIGMPGMGVPMVAPGMSMGMVQSSPMGMPFGGISPMGPAGNPLLIGPGGPAPSSLILGGPSGMGGVSGGSMGGGTTGTSTNPFLL